MIIKKKNNLKIEITMPQTLGNNKSILLDQVREIEKTKRVRRVKKVKVTPKVILMNLKMEIQKRAMVKRAKRLRKRKNLVNL